MCGRGLWRRPFSSRPKLLRCSFFSISSFSKKRQGGGHAKTFLRRGRVPADPLNFDPDGTRRGHSYDEGDDSHLWLGPNQLRVGATVTVYGKPIRILDATEPVGVVCSVAFLRFRGLRPWVLMLAVYVMRSAFYLPLA